MIDGSVDSTSAEQVKRDLMAQGLIPVFVRAEKVADEQTSPAIKLAKLASNGA